MTEAECLTSDRMAAVMLSTPLHALAAQCAGSHTQISRPLAPLSLLRRKLPKPFLLEAQILRAKEWCCKLAIYSRLQPPSSSGLVLELRDAYTGPVPLLLIWPSRKSYG